jgi:hypothetical protein
MQAPITYMKQIFIIIWRVSWVSYGRAIDPKSKDMGWTESWTSPNFKNLSHFDVKFHWDLQTCINMYGMMNVCMFGMNETFLFSFLFFSGRKYFIIERFQRGHRKPVPHLCTTKDEW